MVVQNSGFERRIGPEPAVREGESRRSAKRPISVIMGLRRVSLKQSLLGRDQGPLSRDAWQELPVLLHGHSRPWRSIMTYSHLDPAMQSRAAWNAGKTVGTKRPLTQKQIWAIRFFLDREERLRDRALFDLAIDSKLRGCDLVKLKTGDLLAGSDIRNRAMVIQQKTGRPVQFEITADARSSLAAWLQRRGGTAADYVFPSRFDHGRPMSTRQYARLVDEWVTAIGLRREDYGTHSMRRTKAAMIYRATGNLRAVQILLGHTKIENTVRYLGVDVEDALILAERTEI